MPRLRPFDEQTHLERIRRYRGVSQETLAKISGVPLTVIYRIETRREDNPGVRHLRNLALALEAPFERLLEEEWTEWTPFDRARAPEPPKLASVIRRPVIELQHYL